MDFGEDSVIDRIYSEIKDIYNELFDIQEKLKILKDIDFERLAEFAAAGAFGDFEDAEHLRTTYLGVE